MKHPLFYWVFRLKRQEQIKARYISAVVYKNETVYYCVPVPCIPWCCKFSNSFKQFSCWISNSWFVQLILTSSIYGILMPRHANSVFSKWWSCRRINGILFDKSLLLVSDQWLLQNVIIMLLWSAVCKAVPIYYTVEISTIEIFCASFWGLIPMTTCRHRSFGWVLSYLASDKTRKLVWLCYNPPCLNDVVGAGPTAALSQVLQWMELCLPERASNWETIVIKTYGGDTSPAHPLPCFLPDRGPCGQTGRGQGLSCHGRDSSG